MVRFSHWHGSFGIDLYSSGVIWHAIRIAAINVNVHFYMLIFQNYHNSTICAKNISVDEIISLESLLNCSYSYYFSLSSGGRQTDLLTYFHPAAHVFALRCKYYYYAYGKWRVLTIVTICIGCTFWQYIIKAPFITILMVLQYPISHFQYIPQRNRT